MSAISHCHVLFVTSHDSIGVGEDGPTHQSIEQLEALRAMPNLLVMRPCDGKETVGCYKVAVKRNTGPSLLALSRQGGLANLPGTSEDGVTKGGYTVAESEGDGEPDVIIMSTGSEVQIAVEGAKKLREEHNVNPRVVSMVCTDLFDQQPQEYKDKILPPSVTSRVAVEAATPRGWAHYVGLNG
eukprot:scaffold279621_cov41-Prasinocladus_malaysianus.AAC.1